MNKIEIKFNFIQKYFDFYKSIFIFVALLINFIMEKINKSLPLECPSCHSALKVGRLFCVKCHTEVSGMFDMPLLARLSEDEQQFVLDFVLSSGSIKDMAANMGKSYPTVRNILDDLIDKLKKIK